MLNSVANDTSLSVYGQLAAFDKETYILPDETENKFHIVAFADNNIIKTCELSEDYATPCAAATLDGRVYIACRNSHNIVAVTFQPTFTCVQLPLRFLFPRGLTALAPGTLFVCDAAGVHQIDLRTLQCSWLIQVQDACSVAVLPSGGMAVSAGTSVYLYSEQLDLLAGRTGRRPRQVIYDVNRDAIWYVDREHISIFNGAQFPTGLRPHLTGLILTPASNLIVTEADTLHHVKLL